MADGHIQSYLDGLGYPASKDEVKETMDKNNAPKWMIDIVDKLDGPFINLSDISSTYDHFDSPFS